MTAITLPSDSRHQSWTALTAFVVVLAIAVAGVVWAMSGGGSKSGASVELGPVHDQALVCHVNRPC